MKDHIQQLLEQTVDRLKAQAIIPADAAPRLQVDRTKDKSHGDLATNLAMMLAKPAGKNPRELAGLIIDNLPESTLVAKTEIAGPGFINFFLDAGWLGKQIETIASDDRANVAPIAAPQTIVTDYSAPNVAKEMAVHHIRSTVIGDAVTRTLEFLGHNVVRANHIGDWGTQFGMLIAYLEKMENESAADMDLSDLEAFYREAKKCYDEDGEFAERARNYVVKLQGGDEYCNAMWRKLVDITMAQNQAIYDRLGVSLSNDDIMGESLYNPMLPEIVADLTKQGLAVEDQGAKVVFLDEFKGKDGNPMGVIIQKRDGGFLYTTTDIAAAKYRVDTFAADRILYFIDSRQAQHLQQAWLIARKAGYLPDTTTTEHCAFGMMLGKDGKPFKTRSGGTVKLADLLEEAHQRATKLIGEKNPDLQGDALDTIAATVAMASVKYSDLSKNRTTDYVFDWDNMLTFEGNTAPYMLYAFSRIQSIFRKAGVNAAELNGTVVLAHDKEEALAQKLVQFNDAVQGVANKGMPHLMCTYLYELAGAFMSFYEACPINKDDVAEDAKASRLRLCAATANTLKVGLGLLGINTLDRM
ncbi:arginyl-tRNA synthetase [Ferrimonas balearica DSM 9799]|uniref:Arginine--tRNA ligase n=1 Tax=Ferrimonas balearica (strain DSM 9799 / CCM 4581 / KCTC 23876 / PAT) TaxID=550540 RepID=E1SN61_FERBD|nr:arginine--tRNA ligase [Ferrimonas balearica]ADN77719.1 arginyl-tRNA synthetase [Ferrimonas balearica DSM 9799]MBY5981793.1 arginine--tRNA ligase [Ferrimonas balearica]